ncbi:thioredoxin family protein [Arthrobacter sp. Sr33]
MNPFVAAAIVVVLVLGALGIGLAMRHRSGVKRSVQVGEIAPADVDLAVLGERATVVQFSTAYCSRCPGVRRALTNTVRDYDGVVYTDVDLTHRPHLASRLKVMQTPTVLVVNPNGDVAARYAGAVSVASIRAEIDTLEGPGDDRLAS